MAWLESISYIPHHSVVSSDHVIWQPDHTLRRLEKLPQIFWKDGSPWNEANYWALDKVRSGGVKIKTVVSLMGHIHKYANWLEMHELDWRHFPQRKSDRVLVKYRGNLIENRDSGYLSPSTTTARMQAAIQFYRHCAIHNFVSRGTPMWRDNLVVVRYFDSVGFERTLQRLSTDLSIPNRARPGLKLEDGLLPITGKHMSELLRFTSTQVSTELHLMLSLGFFTGARIGTISTLRIENIENAIPNPAMPRMWKIAIGPGTGVDTKFDVSGHLLVPDFMLDLLKQHAYSTHRLKRESRATKSNKSLLFLTRFGNQFPLSSINREMTTLRRRAIKNGMKFMQLFHFHQSRATYGTWLMTIALSKVGAKSALQFVKACMLHKDEATTLRYITFIEHTNAKIEMANAFTEAFGGLESRLGDPIRA